MDYRVLLYYNYTKIENPEQFAKEHLALCKSLGLKGRILVAEEGINGTAKSGFSKFSEIGKNALSVFAGNMLTEVVSQAKNAAVTGMRRTRRSRSPRRPGKISSTG